MKKKKILIISYSYPPSNDPAANRPYYFAKYLDKNKFEVSVLTCKNQDSSLGFTPADELVDVNKILIKSLNLRPFRKIKSSKMFNDKENKNIFHRFKILLFKIFSFFLFPDKAITWLPYVLIDILLNKNKYKTDIIFSTSPHFTNHLIARIISFINKNSMTISDFRDYHYIENYEFHNGLKAYLNKLLENYIIKKSNKIIVISKSMEAIYKSRYNRYASKFNTIYNGYDPNKPFINKTIPRKQPLTIFYAGSFYGKLRNPMPLLLAFESLVEKQLLDINDIRIEIAGNIDAALLTEFKNLKITKSINLLGVISKNKVVQKYYRSHLLWLIVAKKKSHYTSVPIKLYEYFASKRPIIYFGPNNSEVTNIINKYKLGFNFNNDDDLEITKKRLLKIIDLYKKGNLNNQLNIKHIDLFRVDYQTKFLEKIILNNG